MDALCCVLDGKVWRELCREKRVNIAYVHDPPYFAVDRSGEMVRYPVDLLRAGLYSYTPYNWEILATFLQLQDTGPVWINCSTWGSQDPGTGRWTGRRQRGS